MQLSPERRGALARTVGAIAELVGMAEKAWQDGDNKTSGIMLQATERLCQLARSLLDEEYL